MKPQVRVRRAVARMRAPHVPIEGRAGKLRLDFNENTQGCSPKVRAALALITRERVGMYPEYEAARRRLARFFRVAPAELLLANGADDALRLIADAFLECGSRVLVVEPTFPMYHHYVAVADARLVRLRHDAEMRFPLADALRALRRGPRVFFLANPNNPTGTLVGRNDLRAILRAAKKTIVVVDEAYWEFAGVTALPWIRRYPNLLVARTFSKAAGLAGLRIGCLFGNRELIAEIRKTQPPFAVNSAAMIAAEAAIQDTSYIRRYVREVRLARKELATALAGQGIKVFPSGANFLLADFGSRAPAILRALARQGILLRDRTADFGRGGYVRITVGTRPQMRRLVRALGRLT
jgi:histidinol-phosphate aminotransferase